MRLGGLAQFALVVVLLAWGKPILAPVALAFYLAFVLTPPSDWLERAGLPRGLSLTSVTGATLSILIVLSTVLVAQAMELARQMRVYSVSMREKLAKVPAGNLWGIADLNSALAELSQSLDYKVSPMDAARPAAVASGGLSSFRRIADAIEPLITPVALAALVLVITVFVLAHREDLRARFIQLVGPQNVTVATRTMAEAVKRVSYFLLTQAYINTSFGVVVALGLYLIGVPYAVLWGVIAALSRFVPLIGAFIATVPPALLAFAIFPGFQHALLTVALIVITDALIGNFIEPVVVGKRTGVSALSLLLSALFWTWLWGPLGLVLATPLTVCAAVVGRHVPALGFLAIALGEESGLHAEINFYQRTLARSIKDVHRLAARKVAESSLNACFDELVIPALRLMVSDQHSQAIQQSTAERVVKDLEEVTTRLAGTTKRADASLPTAFGVPAESAADVLLLKMLATVGSEQGVSVSFLESTDRSQAVERLVELRASVICVAALPLASNASARFFCRRLRAGLPNAFIMVLLPEPPEQPSREAAARLREAGANVVASTLREASSLLVEQLASKARARGPAEATKASDES